MTFGLSVIGIYVIIFGIYALAVSIILRRITKKHSKRKEDNNANN